MFCFVFLLSLLKFLPQFQALSCNLKFSMPSLIIMFSRHLKYLFMLIVNVHFASVFSNKYGRTSHLIVFLPSFYRNKVQQLHASSSSVTCLPSILFHIGGMTLHDNSATVSLFLMRSFFVLILCLTFENHLSIVQCALKYFTCN